MLPPKNAAAAIVESAAALALSVPAPTHFANRPWGLVIAHSLARGEHLRHLLLEKRIAFDIVARPALPAVAETAHPMPDVEKKRVALLLAVVADIDTGFDLLDDDPAQCRLANPVELRAHAILAQSRVICDATDLPVSADLEKGFGDAPEIVAETIRLAAESGLVSCSIEDASGNPDAPIFEIGHATERIAAAAAAARALPFPFTLTGRTENFLRGRLDLEDTIKRLKSV